ncbi:hypothetical protein B7486_07465 [cyanobacterium TDX16]|nr:hypothetical protein B7486_07465 [cyanobacterium TDX16]
MPIAAARPDFALPSQDDQSLAKESSRLLSPFANDSLRVKVIGEGDAMSREIVIPVAAVRLLCRLLNEMALGNAVTLIPIHAEMTTQEAADLLGVSRPFVIKEIESGKIEFKKVGTHRRIAIKEILRYKQKIDSSRAKTLNDLAAQAQELNMGY